MKQRVSKSAKLISISMLLSSAMIAGGIAYADGSAISACVNKKTGLTRIISGKMKCYKSERSLSWNQSGATGSQGATGATGSSGTSAVYKKTITDGADTDALTDGQSLTIVTATLPAGKYAFQLTAEVTYFNNNISTSHSRFLRCLISTTSDPSTAQTTPSTALWPIVGSNDFFRISFEPRAATTYRYSESHLSQVGTLEFSSATTIYLQCSHETPFDAASSGQEIGIFFPSFIATKVDSLTDAS